MTPVETFEGAGAFARRGDLCSNCFHLAHDAMKVVVGLVSTTHVGRFCFGCDRCDASARVGREAIA